MSRAKHYWRSLSCAMVILFLAVSCAETIVYPYGGYYFSIGSYYSKLVQQMTVGHNTFSFYEQRYAYSPYGDELFAWITAGEKLSTDHSGADPFNLCEGTWKDLDMSEDIMTEMWKQEYISGSTRGLDTQGGTLMRNCCWTGAIWIPSRRDLRRSR